MRVRLHILLLDRKIWWTFSDHEPLLRVAEFLAQVQDALAWTQGEWQARVDGFELLPLQRVARVLHGDDLVVVDAVDDRDDASATQHLVPPGHGTKATHRRNQRRNAAKLELHAPSNSCEGEGSPNSSARPRKKQKHDKGVKRPWQEKLRLSAVECEDDSYQVEVPPFPFVQLEVIKDLPPLPKDLSELQAAVDPVEVGSVIAFKILAMDASYQPRITKYQSARVVNISSDGYHLELAKRDQPRHDPTQGKFAAPGNPPESTEELVLEFSKLIDPLLVNG